MSFVHPDGHAICKALIADDLIPNLREPDIPRFGTTPLYMTCVDVWDAVDMLERTMADRLWVQLETDLKGAVT